MTRGVAVYVLSFVLATPVAAAAQAPAQAPAPPPRELTAAFAFTGTSGNASTESLGLNGGAIFRSDDWETSDKVDYLRSETTGTIQAQSVAFTHRTSRSLTPRLSAFGQYGFLHDLFAGTRERHAIDLGASYAWIKTGTQQLDADAALGYAYERRIDGPRLSSAIASLGGHYRWALSKTSTIEDEARVTSSLSIARDWRVENDISASAALVAHLSLKLTHTVRYVHLPAPGFKTTDTTTALAIALKY